MRFTPCKNGYESIFLDMAHIPLTENYEYICSGDSGKVFSSDVDGIELSLQKIVAGNTVTFFNTGLDNRCEMKIKAFQKNGIMYKGHGLPEFGLINPRHLQKRGDYIKLASLDAKRDANNTIMWQVVEARGHWEKFKWELYQ